jgi:hypothetical protein
VISEAAASARSRLGPRRALRLAGSSPSRAVGRSETAPFRPSTSAVGARTIADSSPSVRTSRERATAGSSAAPTPNTDRTRTCSFGEYKPSLNTCAAAGPNPSSASYTTPAPTRPAPTCRSHSSVCSRLSGDAASSRSIMIEAAIGRSSSLRRSSTGLVRRQLVRSVLELRVLLPSRYSRRRLRHHMSKLRVLESSCPGFEVFRSGRPWYSGS